MLGEGLIELFGPTPIALGILALFWQGDEALSSKAREDLSLRLLLFKVDGTDINWSRIVWCQFNRFFGIRHLSKKCFLASSLISFIAAIIIFSYLSYSEYTTIVSGAVLSVGDQEYFIWPTMSFHVRPIILLVWSIIFFNIFIDYISLLETRYILRIMRMRNDKQWLLVILDFMFTSLIFLIGLGLALIPLDFYSPTLSFEFPHQNGIVHVNSDLILYFALPIALFTSLFTTFITSIWIVSVFIGGNLIKALPRIGVTVEFIQYALPIDEKPVRSIGIIATLITIVLLIITNYIF